MASDAKTDSIRNTVSLDAYADLALGPSHGNPGDGPLLMNQAMQAVHVGIVGGLRLAVSFPEAKAGEMRTIGAVLRILGAKGDVEAFLGTPIIVGLGMAGLLSAGEVRDVPGGINEGVAYVRARPDKFLPSSWDRMDRRARARRKTGRGLDEDDIVRRREVLRERGAEMESLPSFSLASASTSRRYPIYVGAKPLPPSGGQFTSYGLSDGMGAVPWF